MLNRNKIKQASLKQKKNKRLGCITIFVFFNVFCIHLKKKQKNPFSILHKSLKLLIKTCFIEKNKKQFLKTMADEKISVDEWKCFIFRENHKDNGVSRSSLSVRWILWYQERQDICILVVQVDHRMKLG